MDHLRLRCLDVSRVVPGAVSSVADVPTRSGPVYRGLKTVGSDPSRVYRIAAAPDPESVAFSETETGPEYQPLEQEAASQLAVDVGGCESLLITWPPFARPFRWRRARQPVDEGLERRRAHRRRGAVRSAVVTDSVKHEGHPPAAVVSACTM